MCADKRTCKSACLRLSLQAQRKPASLLADQYRPIKFCMQFLSLVCAVMKGMRATATFPPAGSFAAHHQPDHSHKRAPSLTLGKEYPLHPPQTLISTAPCCAYRLQPEGTAPLGTRTSCCVLSAQPHGKFLLVTADFFEHKALLQDNYTTY